MFGDWTDRIAEGELPATKPQRPQGVERNVVVTLWDWANPKAYLHDEIATDKRNPTVNANGLVYGATEDSTDIVPVLDPVKNTADEVKHPGARSEDPVRRTDAVAPSPYWGDEAIWDGQTSIHNPMLRRERPRLVHSADPAAGQPRLLQEGLRPSVREGVSRSSRSNRQVSMYDPKTGRSSR